MIKQVIVYRRYYPDKDNKTKQLRTGKIVAQCCHASIAFLTKKLHNNIELTNKEKEWIKDGFRKICLYVDSEYELLTLVEKAKLNNINCDLITDSGYTEFDNVPTITCLAIGPDYSEKIDKITGDLKLL